MISLEFEAKYGILTEGLNKDNGLLARLFYPIFLIRRFFFTLCLICLYDYPIVQLAIILVYAALPVILLSDD